MKGQMMMDSGKWIIALILIVGTLIGYSYLKTGNFFDFSVVQTLINRFIANPFEYLLFIWFGIIIGHFIWRQV